ncbi:TPA: helix-turn-helix domain-containing protein [Burkholderia vietnamiensis]|nr:helix-turn-helix domain-containing protein [Burkholderia vietnamiensis]HDR8978165.1 helix-turn-helix domain-containing protein [Burkholderia vietnamiensis]
MMLTVPNVITTGSRVRGDRGRTIGRRRDSVIVLLLDGFSIMQMGRLAAVFELANRLERVNASFEDRYELRLHSSHGGAVRSSSGVQIWTDAPRPLDTSSVQAMFVLGGQGRVNGLDEPFIGWLHHAHQRARVVKGDGAGVEMLSAIRLNQKTPETVPPALQASLAVCNPGEAEQSSDGDEGMFAAALSIVVRDAGYEIAQEIVACMMPGASRKFASVLFGAQEARASELIRAAALHLRANSANRISIANAAQAAAMSERNFLRRFKNEIGVTPTEFVLRVRLEKACCMLVETDLPADKVARRVGLGSGDRLAKLFRQHLSMSPTEYRAAARDRMIASADGVEWRNGTFRR